MSFLLMFLLLGPTHVKGHVTKKGTYVGNHSRAAAGYPVKQPRRHPR